MRSPVKKAEGRFLVPLFLAGMILVGLGFLGFKLYTFEASPRVEILGEGTSGQDAILIVEASGEVIKPGVYELPPGSRVNDLLVTAGGLSAGADRDWVDKNLNLAQKLTDGVKIYIPGKKEATAGADSQSVVAGKTNINTASESELDKLWGVGPATAQKIMAGRPYLKIEELLEKKIVNANVWAAIKDKISLY